MKQCMKCGQLLHESCFSKNNSRTDGLYEYCKECRHLMRSTTEEGRQSHRNRALAQEGLRQCFRCKQIKPLTDYYVKRNGKPRSICSECSRAVRQGAGRRQEFLAEQERLSALLASGQYWCTRCKTAKPLSEFYYRNGKPRSQCKACISELTVAAYHADPAKTKDMNMRKYHNHKEERKAYHKKYNNTPAGRAMRKGIEMRRRALEHNAISEDYTAQLTKVYESPIYVCRYCRLMFSTARGGKAKDETLTIDHVIPYHKGGNDVWGNVVPACFECNRAKLAKDADKFDAYEREDAIIRAMTHRVA